MNVYDTNRICDLLHAKFAVERIDDPAKADILILMTCSIREKAEEKVFSLLGRWRNYKKIRPEVIIAVTGCVASQEGENIRVRAPFVDVVVGPQTLHRLPELLVAHQQKGKPQVDVSFPEIEKFDNLPTPRAEGPCAYLSIMEGCSKYCSYCIVPYTRGEEIHRPFNDILVEAIALSRQSVKEITLLGQNVNAYTYTREDNQTVDLASLIAYLSEIPGIERLRFTTSHPMVFGQRLISAYASEPKLANHLHLPVQSGSDRILNRMKRGHTCLEYIEKINALRVVRPNISITSDFIVGFPGESDDDFAQTLELVDTVGFDQSFSFIYSQRPGTPAAGLKDDVSMDVKKTRLQKLQALLSAKAREISHSMIGTKQVILVTGQSKKDLGQQTGRTENNRIVNFESSQDLTGKLVEVEITESLSNCLLGKLSAQLCLVDC